MPSLFVPSRSGVHRTAGIALFRALLSQCRLQNQGSDALQNVVRNRFRANKNTQSQRLLTDAFNAGYEALDILMLSAEGDRASRSKLLSLIPQIPKRLKQFPPQPRPQAGKTKKFSTALEASEDPATEERTVTETSLVSRHAVLSRPYAKISGKRHVPYLTRTNGISFLRLKKPQPAALSGILNKRIKRRQELINKRFTMDNISTPMGEDEDEWDKIIARETNGGVLSFPSTDNEGVWKRLSWAHESRKLAHGITETLRAETRANVALSHEMSMVVRKERELARKETRRARKKRKYAGKKEQKSSDNEALSPARDAVVMAQRLKIQAAPASAPGSKHGDVSSHPPG